MRAATRRRRRARGLARTLLRALARATARDARARERDRDVVVRDVVLSVGVGVERAVAQVVVIAAAAVVGVERAADTGGRGAAQLDKCVVAPALDFAHGVSVVRDEELVARAYVARDDEQQPVREERAARGRGIVVLPREVGLAAARAAARAQSQLLRAGASASARHSATRASNAAALSAKRSPARAASASFSLASASAS